MSTVYQVHCIDQRPGYTSHGLICELESKPLRPRCTQPGCNSFATVKVKDRTGKMTSRSSATVERK